MLMLTPAQAETLIEQHLDVPADRIVAAHAGSGRRAARKHLRRARSAAVRSRGDGWHRARPPRPRLTTPGACASPARRPPAIRRRRLPDRRHLHRNHDRRHVAARLRRGGAGRAGAAQRRVRGDRPQAGAAVAERASPRLRLPAGRAAAGGRHAPDGAGGGDRRRRRHGAPARQRPTHDRGDLHRQRARSSPAKTSSRTRCAAPTPTASPPRCASMASRASPTITCATTKRELTERLGFHLRTHDVLILSGGVSMGKLDLVPKVLEKLGVSLVFHHIAQRPGKPMWFGVSQSGPAVFALPGNPVSTLVCLARYVLPALRAAMGQAPDEPPRIALTAPGRRQGAAGLLHAGETQERRLGPHVGRTLSHQWLRRLHGARRHRRLHRAAARARTRFRRVSWRASSAGESQAPWTRAKKSIPLAALDRARPRAAATRCGGRSTTCASRSWTAAISVVPIACRARPSTSRTASSRAASAWTSPRSCAWRACSCAPACKKLRITGGEPLLRPNLADLIGDLTSAARHRGHRAHHQRHAAGQVRHRAQGRGTQSHHRESRHARSGGVREDERRLRRRRGSARRHRTRAPRGPRAHQDQYRRAARRQRSHRCSTCWRISAAPASSCASSNTWTWARAITGTRRWWCRRASSRRRISRALAARAARSRLPRRSRRTPRIRRRRRRSRLHLLRVAAVLRRLLARAHLLRRLVLHLPVRDPGHGPARARCAPAPPTRSFTSSSAACGAAAATATASCAPRCATRPELHKVEMNYIGG